MQKKRVLHTLRNFTFHILKLIEKYFNLGALIVTCYSQLKQCHLLTKPGLHICQACIGSWHRVAFSKTKHECGTVIFLTEQADWRMEVCQREKRAKWDQVLSKLKVVGIDLQIFTHHVLLMCVSVLYTDWNCAKKKYFLKTRLSAKTKNVGKLAHNNDVKGIKIVKKMWWLFLLSKITYFNWHLVLPAHRSVSGEVTAGPMFVWLTGFCLTFGIGH